VEASFVQFDSLEILAGVPQATELTLSAEPILRFDDKDGYSMAMDRIRDDALAHPGTHRTSRLDPVGFTVDAVPLTFLECRYAGRLVTMTATCTAVSSVGAPGASVALRDITVQKFDHSVSELIQRGNEAHLLVDVGRLKPPSDAILHELRVTFPKVMTVGRYELVGTRTLSTPANKIRLSVATTTY
jgi:hypothetical protein